VKTPIVQPLNSSSWTGYMFLESILLQRQMAETFGCLKGPKSRYFECTYKIAQAGERPSVLPVWITLSSIVLAMGSSPLDRKHQRECGLRVHIPIHFQSFTLFGSSRERHPRFLQFQTSSNQKLTKPSACFLFAGSMPGSAASRTRLRALGRRS
jgi:hypothetical protein